MLKIRKRRCKECNEPFTPTFSTVQSVCSPKCAIAYSSKKDKQVKEKNKVELDKMFIEKKQREGLTTLIKSVVTTCHLYIRLRDTNKPCISCGTAYKDDFDAGHFYKAELFSSLKFDERNINGQCIQCNRREEGNLNDYELNLPERIGKFEFTTLQDRAYESRHKTFKWDREKLIEIRNYYKTKIKTL